MHTVIVFREMGYQEEIPHYVCFTDLSFGWIPFYTKFFGVPLRHFIISFYPNELNTPAIANEIAKQFAAFFVHEYQVIYAVHENKPQLHIHMIINSVSYVDGHRYYGTRAEFKSMQKHMQNILRNHNIYRLDYVSAS